MKVKKNMFFVIFVILKLYFAHTIQSNYQYNVFNKIMSIVVTIKNFFEAELTQGYIIMSYQTHVRYYLMLNLNEIKIIQASCLKSTNIYFVIMTETVLICF